MASVYIILDTDITKRVNCLGVALPLRHWYSTWTHPLKWEDSFWVLVAHTLALLGCSRKKFRQGWLKHSYFFQKIPGIFRFVIYPWKFWRKQSFTLRNFTKLYYNPWEFQDQKPSPMEIPHDCFWLGENCTLFYLIPGISICSSISLEILMSSFVGFLVECPIMHVNYHILFWKTGNSIYLSFKPEKGNISI